MAGNTLYVAVKGDTKDLIRALKDAENRSTRSGKAMSKGIGTATKAMGALTAAVTAYLGIGLVRETIRVADTYTMLESKLKLVTSETESLKAVQAELLGVANDSRVTYQSTVELYARLKRATQDLGVSSQEVATATETVSKALVVAGSTSEEASSAMLQLSQGLAKGRLDGDELKSVMESMPDLMRLVAKSMGVAYGELKGLGAQGELTAEKIFPALVKALGEVDEQHKQMSATVGQAMDVLRNSFFDVVNDANKASNGTGQVAKGILEVAKVIRENKETISDVFAGFITGGAKAVETTGNVVRAVQGLAIVAASEDKTFLDWFLANPEDMRRWQAEIDSGVAFAKDRLKTIENTFSQLSMDRLFAKQNSAWSQAQEDQWTAMGARVDQYRQRVEDLKVAAIVGYEEEGKAAQKSGETQQQAAEDSSQAIIEINATKNKKILTAEESLNQSIEQELDRFYDGVERKSETWTEDYIKNLEDQEDAQKKQLRNIDAALAEYFVEVNDKWREHTDYVGDAVDKLFGKMVAGQRTTTGEMQKIFGSWAENLVTGEFDSIGDAWDSLWKGMLGTVVNTVAEMGANFVVDEVVGAFFSHKGTYKLKNDEYQSVLLKDQMVIPPEESRQIRANIGSTPTDGAGFNAIVKWTGLASGGGGGDYGGAPDASIGDRSKGKQAGIGASTAEKTGTVIGGFLGKIGGKLSGAPLGSPLGKELGRAFGGMLGDMLGDVTNTRGMEYALDALENGTMSIAEATKEADAARSMHRGVDDPTTSRSFGGFAEALDSAQESVKGFFAEAYNDAMDAIGLGESSQGGGKFGGGPGADLGAAPGGNRQSSDGGYTGPGFGSDGGGGGKFGGGPGADLGAAPGGNRQSSEGGYSGPGFGGDGGGGGSSGGPSGGPSGGIGADGNRGGGYGGLHGGIAYVPKETTYLLDKGERVLSPKQNKDLTKYLRNAQQKAGDVIVKIYLDGKEIKTMTDKVIVERGLRGIPATQRVY